MHVIAFDIASSMLLTHFDWNTSSHILRNLAIPCMELLTWDGAIMWTVLLTTNANAVVSVFFGKNLWWERNPWFVCVVPMQAHQRQHCQVLGQSRNLVKRVANAVGTEPEGQDKMYENMWEWCCVCVCVCVCVWVCVCVCVCVCIRGKVRLILILNHKHDPSPGKITWSPSIVAWLREGSVYP